MRQSKTLSTIDERGSEIATASVFDCQWSPVGRLMAIEKSVSNYFWSTFDDNIDVFDCHQSDVNSLYTSLCYGGHFCIQLNKIIWNCLCLKGRYIRGSSNKEWDFFYSAVNLHARLMKFLSMLTRLFGCSHVPYSTFYIVPTFVARQH